MIAVIFAAVLGAVVGSFCNVVIWRLPKILTGEAGMSLSWPASHCPDCRRAILWRHNIPLLGWLCLRGRCHHCQQRISLRYPLVELAIALLFGAAFYAYGMTVNGITTVMIMTLLLLLFFVDMAVMLLPDCLTLPLFIIVLWLAWSQQGIVGWQEACFSAMSGYLIPWFTNLLFRWRYHRQGMGSGDMKLFAAIGGWLGLNALFTIMVMAALLALVFAVCVLKLRRGEVMAFGPYIIVATLLQWGALTMN